METVRCDELDLFPQVLRAIKEMGFEEATPIQSQAIPVVMSGTVHSVHSNTLRDAQKSCFA